MPDPRIALRKELKKVTDAELLKRYCKLAGRLFNDEKYKYPLLMKSGQFQNDSRAAGCREFLTDMIVAAETRRG